jgi:hypothetical protein
MTKFPITKIQILCDKETGHPLFYCHSEDRDHEPCLSFERTENKMVIRAKQTLYKVKFNPQTKNRVDIYMSLPQAWDIGMALMTLSQTEPLVWQVSSANPNAAAKGNMRLPTIIWARSARFLVAAGRVRTGANLKATSGYINVDLEYPADTHIKMKNHEIHIGVQLGAPTGAHDIGEAVPVHVPEEEFQKSRGEKNPLRKTIGDFYLELSPEVASGLGLLLHNVKPPHEAI